MTRGDSAGAMTEHLFKREGIPDQFPMRVQPRINFKGMSNTQKRQSMEHEADAVPQSINCLAQWLTQVSLRK